MKEKLLKNLKKIMGGFIVALMFSFLIANMAQAADSNARVFFSGLLKDSSGELATASSYNMRFFLYDSSTSTNPLWREEFSGGNKVLVVGGRFQVVLGSQSPFNVDLEKQGYWLGIVIGGEEETVSAWDQEMSPRIQIRTLESLFFEGQVEVSEQEFIDKLIEEFEKNSTSTEALSQGAFLKFLQERLTKSQATAVIISPATLNLLFDKLLNFEQEKNNQGSGGLWATLVDFFRRILDSISNSLGQIFSKISDILVRLTKIEDNLGEVLALLKGDASSTVASLPNTAVNQNKTEEMVSSFGVDFLVEDFGETIIAKGAISVRVFSNYLTTSAKIFVTPKSPISGIWWISDRQNGEYFEISILTPPEEDLKLDYWIVTPKEEILTIPDYSPYLGTSPEPVNESAPSQEATSTTLQESPIENNTEAQSTTTEALVIPIEETVPVPEVVPLASTTESSQ